MTAAAGDRILVIKHGALGDFVQAQGAFQAIRAAHMGARITLLTTAPYAAFARASRLFDDVWIDDRPRLWQIGRLRALIAQLRGGAFDRVYDLQTSARSSWYFYLFPSTRRPEWSGVAKGCSHPHDNRDRDRLHTIDRLAEQLEIAGIQYVPPADLRWVQGGIERFQLGENYILLAPGGSEHRANKRWPAEHFAKLARSLAADGITPVLIGRGAEEAALASRIQSSCPDAVDLTNQTELADLVALARRARAAVGNDTGPMHLFASAGCPTLVLFSRASDPQLCAPRGERVGILRRALLAELPIEDVTAALATLTQAEHSPSGQQARNR